MLALQAAAFQDWSVLVCECEQTAPIYDFSLLTPARWRVVETLARVHPRKKMPAQGISVPVRSAEPGVNEEEQTVQMPSRRLGN